MLYTNVHTCIFVNHKGNPFPILINYVIIISEILITVTRTVSWLFRECIGTKSIIFLRFLL